MRHCRSIPLGLVTASVPGQALVDNTALLEAREAEFKLDTTKPFKINADTNGVCGSSRLGDRKQELTVVRRSCVVHARPPRSHREGGGKRERYILAERPDWVGSRRICTCKGWLPPTERCSQPRPRTESREGM